MTLLPTPNTQNPLEFSATLTGITMLKQYSYRQRLKGSKDYIQTPADQIIHRRELKEALRAPKPKKKPEESESDHSEKKANNQNQNREYVVNKKEVRHRILNYVNQQKGIKKLYFWTVTFPNQTPDNTAYILLNKWLTRLRKEKMITEYLWIAERQENNTIHFHCAIPQYMNVQKANKFMRASIMYSIRDGEIKYTHTQAKNYNGIDIAKNRKTNRVVNFASNKKGKALTNYLTKYVTKNSTSFKHLAWHCSRAFSNLVIGFNLLKSEVIKFNFSKFLQPLKKWENDFAIFIPWKNKPPDSVTKYLAQINNYIQTKYQLSIQ